MAAIVKLEGCYGYGEYNFNVVEMRDLAHEHLGLAIMRFAHEPIKLLLGHIEQLDNDLTRRQPPGLHDELPQKASSLHTRNKALHGDFTTGETSWVAQGA